MAEIIYETTVSGDPGQIRAALTTTAGLAGFYTDQVHAEPTGGSEVWFGFGPAAETQFRFQVSVITGEDVEWTCISGPQLPIPLRPPREGGTLVRLTPWCPVSAERVP